MTDSTPIQGTAAPKPFISRVLGILFSPRETFLSVVAHPKWFGMLALSTVVAALCMWALLSTEAGQQAFIDQSVSAIEGWGRTVDDAMYAQLEKQATIARYINPVAILIIAPIVAFVIAGILLGVFNTVLGGQASYKQVLAVVAHSAPVSVVQQLFTTPLNYFRGSLSSPTNLGVFFPMLEENRFLSSFLGTIDLFFVWATLVTAIGLAVLYKRRTRPVAIGLFVVYGVVALGIALAKSFFSRGS
jgi:hypothetical protein